MNLRWLSSLPKQDKNVMRARVMESHDVLKRLSELLRDDLESSYTQMAKEDKYQRPAWAEYQAHKLGEQACLRKLLDLINIEE